MSLGANLLLDACIGLLSFVIAGISLAAGVGGGGLFVPLIMMALNFDIRIASALSQSMLVGGALAAFGYNLMHTHPSAPGRPLVDFELACLCGPALMAGAQIGSVVHATLPTSFLVVLLVVVLADAAKKGWSNAVKISEKEKAAAQEASGSAEKAMLEASKPADNDSDASSVSEDEAISRIRDAQIKLFCIWIFNVILNIAKGLLLPVCNPLWWFLVLGAAVVLGGFSYYYASALSKQEPMDEHSTDFRELAFTLVKWSMVAGVVAAICGIGGGMIMGPILVGLKVPPPVSSATTATTLLVLSSSIAVVYVCRQYAPLDYSLYLCAMTTSGALTGKVVIGRWVKRTGKQSVIVWCLVGITVASVGIMGGLGLYRTVMNRDKAFQFTNFCMHEPEHNPHLWLGHSKGGLNDGGVPHV
jgi:uncharacterized membrane protein YfcA